MARYAMVIDLHRCTGCGACIIGCKQENNLSEGKSWSSKITQTSGKFPNLRYHYRPTLCNHCEKPPCARGCPTRAMYKAKNGFVLHNPSKCIGCRFCIATCPYGVISYNWHKPHREWDNKNGVIPGCTFSPSELVKLTSGEGLPYLNPEKARTVESISPMGVVEKCTFCHHRVVVGQDPYCVDVCPSRARIFGDMDDPNSEVNELIAQHQGAGLKENLGTRPKVKYIRDYNSRRI